MPDPGVRLLTGLGALAQANGGGLVQEWTTAHSIRLVIVIGMFIVAVVGLGVVLLAIRRRMFAQESDMTSARTLMDDLRAMRESGEMSEEEYNAARRALTTKVAAKARKAAADEPPASYSPKLPRSAMPPPKSASARTAPPGYDLTGAPLPVPAKNAHPKEEGGPR